MCVHFIRGPVCFTNWTGIVVEVKRGQLKREKGAEKERGGWRSGDLREQQFLTSKEGLQSGQILNPLTYHCKTTHSTFTYTGSSASHEMNIHPLSHCSLSLSLSPSVSLAPCSNISQVVHSEGNIDKAF